MCANDGLIHGRRKAEVIGVDNQPTVFKAGHSWAKWSRRQSAATTCKSARACGACSTSAAAGRKHQIFRAPVFAATANKHCPSVRRRPWISGLRSEEHTSELQSLRHLVCRLLLE